MRDDWEREQLRRQVRGEPVQRRPGGQQGGQPGGQPGGQRSEREREQLRQQSRGGGAGGGPGGPRPGRRRRARPLRWITNLLAVLVILAVVVFGLVTWKINQTLDENDQPVAVSDQAGGTPTNILLVGSDSRGNLSETQLDQIATEDTGAALTDTIAVLQLARGREGPVLLSIPRDTRVETSGRAQKINAMYGAGGPDLLTRSVEEVTGLTIHHYVEVDMAGFLGVVEALGGVELCNDTGEPLVDPKANLNMPPGCQNMNGAEALAFVRSRSGPKGDFDRIKNQQQFMRSVVKESLAPGQLLNVPATLNLIDSMSGTVSVDERMNAFDVYRVAWGARGELDTRTLPSTPAAGGGAACLEPKPEAEELLAAMRRGDAQLPDIGDPETAGF